MKQVIFENGVLHPRIEINKRSGKPKPNWLNETYKDSHELLNLPMPFYLSNEEIRHKIHKAAMEIIEIFKTKPKKWNPDTFLLKSD